MNFAYDDEQELLRQTTRRFLQGRHPIAAVREKLEAPVTLDRDVWRSGAELGWTALLVPQAYGGGSVTHQPLVDLAAVAEVLGSELFPGPVLETNVVASVLVKYGDDVQRKEYLPGIAGGDLIATWCVADDRRPRGARVDMRTDGGDVVLDGVARFVRDAHVADILLVTAGDALVVVPAASASIRVHRGLDLTRRYCEVRLETVRVPAGNVITKVGAVGDAFRVATVVQSAEAVGAGERLFDATVQYAKDRVQFGRPIGSFQAIKHRLADLLVGVEAARAASRYAALAVADEQDDRDQAVAVAGAYVRDAVAHLCGEALQLHGGIGFTWEHDVHLFLRRAKADQGLYGEPSWHRERLVQLMASV